MKNLKITKIAEELSNLGKSSSDNASAISMIDASNLWTTLVSRYDALSITNILFNLTKDEDLKKILNIGFKVLNRHIKVIENSMKHYGIPMPEKPPEHANIVLDVNAITDKIIYRHIYIGIQQTLDIHNHNIKHTNSSTLREKFRVFLHEEIELYDKFIEYGKLKSYLHETPTFRTQK